MSIPSLPSILTLCLNKCHAMGGMRRAECPRGTSRHLPRCERGRGVSDGEGLYRYSTQTIKPSVAFFYRGLQLAHRCPSHTVVHTHPTYQFITGFTEKARVHLSGIPFKCAHYDS